MLSMYSNYNTSDVKAHRTILKSDRDNKLSTVTGL